MSTLSAQRLQRKEAGLEKWAQAVAKWVVEDGVDERVVFAPLGVAPVDEAMAA
jgi:hypothetical protein